VYFNHGAPPPGEAVALAAFEAFLLLAYFSAWAGSSSGWSGRSCTADTLTIALISECVRILTRLTGLILNTLDGFAGVFVTSAFFLHNIDFLTVIASNLFYLRAQLWLANRISTTIGFYWTVCQQALATIALFILARLWRLSRLRRIYRNLAA